MHWADPDHSAAEGAAGTPQPKSFARTAAGRVWRMLAVVLGGAFTGMLIGAPVGLAADAAGLPSGGSAAAAALAFLTIALSVRWLAIRASGAAGVTPLFEDDAAGVDERRVA